MMLFGLFLKRSHVRAQQLLFGVVRSVQPSEIGCDSSRSLCGIRRFAIEPYISYKFSPRNL